MVLRKLTDQIIEKNILWALVLSPLIAPITMILIYLCQYPTHWNDLINYLPGFFIGGSLVAYSAELLLGLPLVFLYQLLSLRNVLFYFAGGAIIGLGISYLCIEPLLSDSLRIAFASALSMTIFRGIIFGNLIKGKPI
jgi:hypothetical protein